MPRKWKLKEDESESEDLVDSNVPDDFTYVYFYDGEPSANKLYIWESVSFEHIDKISHISNELRKNYISFGTKLYTKAISALFVDPNFVPKLL